MARDIEAIRHDIQDTRGRLRDTSEALGWKADLPSRARDMVRETAGVVRERMATSERRPPARREDDSGPGIGERAGHAKEAVGERAGQAKEAAVQAKGAVAERAGAAKEAVAGGASTIGEKAGSAAHAVAGGLTHAKEAVTGGTGSAKESLGGAREGIARRRPDVAAGARRAAGAARSNPTGLLLGALAVGVAAGVMLPRTRTEDEAIGPMADDLRERGMEAGRQAIDRGREAAEQATERAGAAARETVGTG